MSRFSKPLELAPGEDVIKIIHRSPWSYLGRYLFILLFGLVPIFFIIPLFYSGLNGILIFCASILLSFFILFRVLWSMYRNSLVLTNLNIIDVDKKKLFRKKITKFTLEDVQEVYTLKKGWRAKVFNYGNIVFKITSVNGLLVLKHVGDPEYIKDLITATIDTRDDTVVEEVHEEYSRPSDEKMVKMMRKIRTTVGEEYFEQLLEKVYEEDV